MVRLSPGGIWGTHRNATGARDKQKVASGAGDFSLVGVCAPPLWTKRTFLDESQLFWPNSARASFRATRLEVLPHYPARQTPESDLSVSARRRQRVVQGQ